MYVLVRTCVLIMLSYVIFSAATEKDNGSDKESVASKHSESGEKKTGKLEVESQTTDRR